MTLRLVPLITRNGKPTFTTLLPSDKGIVKVQLEATLASTDDIKPYPLSRLIDTLTVFYKYGNTLTFNVRMMLSALRECDDMPPSEHTVHGNVVTETLHLVPFMWGIGNAVLSGDDRVSFIFDIDQTHATITGLHLTSKEGAVDDGFFSSAQCSVRTYKEVMSTTLPNLAYIAPRDADISWLDVDWEEVGWTDDAELLNFYIGMRSVSHFHAIVVHDAKHVSGGMIVNRIYKTNRLLSS